MSAGNQQSNGTMAVEELLAPIVSPPSSRIDGVVIATISGFDEGGSPRITFANNSLRRPLTALSTVAIDATDVGREVAVSFERGDPSRPIILGKLWQSGQTPPVVAEVDRERLVLTASQEIVLQCGEASITLTSAGKIIIRGAYVSSRSTGVNRIQGGAVEIN